MSPLGVVFRRDLALAWRAGVAAPLGFFLGATVLVPLAMGPERALLETAGPPLIWIAAALAALMVLERLFQADLEDGGLDQFFLTDTPLSLIVAAKGAALWVAIGLPLALAGAPAAIAMQAPLSALPAIVASLAVGMAAFIGVGLIAAALAAGVRRAGVLIALIVLPFFAPIIIFGAASMQGFGPAFLLLSGCALAAAALGPIAAAGALRLQAD